MRITAPNYTQTPNDLLDHWLPRLKEGELKILLIIIRKTFGWHREKERISISMFQKLTGLDEKTVLYSLKSLVEKNLIIKETCGEVGKQQSFYELVVDDSNNSYPPKSSGRPPENVGGRPPEIKGDTKETDKETHKKKQQQAAPAAAVFFECLNEVEIPESEKISLSKKFPEEIVRNAVDWAKHPKTQIKTSLTQAIKWACQQNPDIPKDERDIVEENKVFAKVIEKNIKPSITTYVEILNKHVLICFHSQRDPIAIEYSDPGFKEQLQNDLRKFYLI